MTPDRPHIRIEPAVRYGAMTIRGIRVDFLADMVTVDGAAATMDDYRVTREELLLACWAVGAYGVTDLSGPTNGILTRHVSSRHKHWRKWAANHHAALYNGAFDGVPWPPGVEEA